MKKKYDVQENKLTLLNYYWLKIIVKLKITKNDKFIIVI